VGQFRLRSRANPKAWATAIANPVAPGQVDQINAFTLWRPEAVHVTAGAEHIGMFQKTAASQRQYCTKCGGHLMTNHPPLGLIDVFASTLPSLSFRPALHVNYAETVLPMRDGLPKFKDFPAEIGGSGEQMSE
jgi:hypothetical protein